MPCDAVDRQRAVGSVDRVPIRSGQFGGLDSDAGRQGGRGFDVLAVTKLATHTPH